MKLLSNIYIALVALLVMGCERDQLFQEVAYQDNTILSLGITTKAASGNNSIFTDSEDEVKTLRVYAFNGGGMFDCMAYFDSPQSVYRMEVERSKDKNLYFIVNEPEGLSSELNDIKSVADLKGIETTVAGFLNGNSNGFNNAASPKFSMPMSTTITGVDASQDRSLTVNVDRCVSRVDLYLKMGDLYSSVNLDSETKFEVSGVNDDVIIFSGAIPNGYDIEDKVSATSSDVSLSKESTQRVLSFYAAERIYDHEASPIVINTSNLLTDNDRKSFTVTLGDTDDEITSTISKIKRNTIYRINVTCGIKQEIAGTEKVDYKIINWNEVDVDGDLGGVILVADGEVAMDWFRNGYTYTTPAASFGGDRDIEIYAPLSRNEDGTYNYSENPLVTLTTNQSSNVTDFNILGLTDFDDITNWITGARMTTNYLTGQIVFTYQPQDIAYEYESFPIRIKCSNVIKTMNVIYDNGYIPQKNIPTEDEIEELNNMGIGTDWIKDITNGMVVAKRGYNKHPAETKEIMYAKKQSDGSYLYEGEALMSGDEAQRYCQTVLGDAWYLPSKDMLRVVQLKGKELGTSYRFQNTEDTYYWSSTPDPNNSGNYYAVPMEKGNTDPEVSIEATELHHVRCFLNM